MDGVLRDLRYAWRSIRLDLRFTLIVVAVMMLGIGGTVVIFSIVDTVLIKSLPYPHPERLVLVSESDVKRHSTREGVSVPDYMDLVARQRPFESTAAYLTVPRTVTDNSGEAERVTMALVTYEFFNVVGKYPGIGRGFSSTDAPFGTAAVAVISSGFWQRRYGSDPKVIGKTLTIDSVKYTIVGAMANPLRYPTSDTEIWTVLQLNPRAFGRGRHILGVTGRLKPGVRPEEAKDDLARVGRELQAEFPAENTGRDFDGNSLQDETVRPVRPALLVLMASVVAVLLISCTNIASMFLSRALNRVKEVSVRRALGAGYLQCARLFVMEGLLLSFIAAVGGVLLAKIALPALVALAPVSLPRAEEISINLRALLFTLGVTVLTGFGFSLAPIFQTIRGNLQSYLRESSRSASAGRLSVQLRRFLAVAEVAMSAALIIGAGLMIKSFWRLWHVDPGFRAEQVMKFEFQLPPNRYPQNFRDFPNWPEVKNFTALLLQNVKNIPSARSVALAASHPLNAGFTSTFSIVGRLPAPQGQEEEIRVRGVSPGYFATVGIPLIRGRLLEETDREGQPPVTLINEAAARHYFPGEDPIGKEVGAWMPPLRIVGIVGNERFMGLSQDVTPAIYPPIAQVPMASLSLLVRSESSVSQLTDAVRREFAGLDPSLAVYNVEPMTEVLERSMAQARFASLLVGSFAGVAWLLAILGVHAVLSYSVAQRTQEIGVRMALGAQPRDVLRLVMKEGAAVAALGLVAGLATAWLATRLLASMLFNVEPRDLTVFTAAPLSFMVTALLASYLPARRAIRVSPSMSLRNE